MMLATAGPITNVDAVPIWLSLTRNLGAFIRSGFSKTLDFRTHTIQDGVVQPGWWAQVMGTRVIPQTVEMSPHDLVHVGTHDQNTLSHRVISRIG